MAGYNRKKRNESALHAERMEVFRNAGLYFVTSQPLSKGRSTLCIIEEALAAGVKLIQLREKEMATRDFTALAFAARKLTAASGALLIINDRPDIAMAVDADGVHLGQDDFPAEHAVRLAPEMIVGVSTHNEAEAVAAEKHGASYVNIGPVFPTATKEYPGEYIGLAGIDRISETISIDFTVMGGIKETHIPDLLEHGARTIALVTAVTMADDPREAAGSLLRAIRQGRTSV